MRGGDRVTKRGKEGERSLKQVNSRGEKVAARGGKEGSGGKERSGGVEGKWKANGEKERVKDKCGQWIKEENGGKNKEVEER